ncbi:Uu.00g007550.m01.CDS01 [Anthostomella pinea]|uniref:Uu.00g007550.m01.CDS01 n=1 Tax=Anthostomella pinea TaxID=933095 RepID=A0AAI8YPX1_9PEZI|nr:Uu.00g007550.m01.CDS01 [Anthostomella pinea]
MQRAHHEPAASPLLLGTFALEAETMAMRHWIQDQSHQLFAVQEQTGHHLYQNVPQEDVLDSMDLSMLSKRTCGLAVNITTSALCLQRLVQLGDFLIEESKLLTEEIMTSSQQPDSHQAGQRTCETMRTRSYIHGQVRTWRGQAKALLDEAEAWRHKTDIIVQTLLTLTTQRDQTIGIQIARDSRTLAEKATRDSTLMKAIAAVTMCFLPGTFVASLFAMDMFDWRSPLRSTVSEHFWVYWAVTVSLTMLVVLGWLAWSKYSEGSGVWQRWRKV